MVNLDTSVVTPFKLITVARLQGLPRIPMIQTSGQDFQKSIYHIKIDLKG